MQSMRDFRNALVVALISIGLTIGSLSISLVEFVPQAIPTPTNIILPSPLPLTATSTLIPSPTSTTGAESPTPSPTWTFTITASPPASCQPPAGWGQIIVRADDTLESIAQRYHTTRDALRAGNCLLSDNLVAGSILYAPSVTTATMPSCSPGASGWSKSYVVMGGDTLYTIATNHYSTVGLLKSVNCKSTDLILPGEVLWVPDVATRTPPPTPLPGDTVTPIPTEPLTETALPFTVTPQPTETPVPDTATPSPTEAPTNTPEPSPTPTLTPFPVP